MTSKSDENVYNEICDKIQIAKNVLPRTEKAPVKFETNIFVRTMCYYTGVDSKTIDELVRRRKPRKTFFDLLRMKNNKHEASVISFEQMRNILIDQYVMNQQIPTKNSIVKAIKTIEKANKGYTPSILKQDLNNLGFIWKRLPKSDRYIVVENTEQFSNRMKYLQQMKEYRESNRVLIHVERTLSWYILVHTSEHRAHTTEIIVVASPQLGLIDTCFPPKLKTLEFFLRNKLHTVPPNSVFVIEQSNPSGVDLERTCKLPTIHSQKKDMIKWLEAYDIPCDSTLHRGELFALIQKHKVNCPPYYRCCEMLKAAGHDVIFRPPEMTYTKYFKRILKGMANKNSMTFSLFKTHVLNKMNLVPQDYWLEEDQKMAAAEQRIYDEDQKLELILDKLMEGIKNKSLSVADFKECEDEELDNDFVENVIFGAYPSALRPGQVKPGPSGSFKPGPSGTSKPGPSGSPKSGPSGSYKPGPSGSPKSGPPSSFQPGQSGSHKPRSSGSYKPGPSSSYKPGLFGPSKPGPSAGSPKSRPSGSSKPRPSGSSKPRPSGSYKPRPSGSSKPGPSGSPKPGPSGSYKPGPSGSPKPGHQAHLSPDHLSD